MRTRLIVLFLPKLSANTYSIASAKFAGEPLFRIDQQTNLILFQGFHENDGPMPLLASKTLFHALSLLLALEANSHMLNCETLHHLGQVLGCLRLDLSHSSSGAASLPTITAILMLISYEYRVEDTQSTTTNVATHINGLQTMIRQSDTLSKWHSSERLKMIQRALFWQDIICSLATGRPRLLQFDHQNAFTCLRQNEVYCNYFVLSEGFKVYDDSWPRASFTVLEDLNAMCHIVDKMHGQERTLSRLPHNEPEDMAVSMTLMEDLDEEGYPLCNSQADLEIRIVDLLSKTPQATPQKQKDQIYRACLFAAYLCTYRLSTGLWEGHFAPEKCVTEILKCMTSFTRHMSPWGLAPDISFWLLNVAGGFTKNQDNRNRAKELVQRYRCFYPSGYSQDWEVTEMGLRKFIWCEHTMQSSFRQFWQACRVA